MRIVIQDGESIDHVEISCTSDEHVVLNPANAVKLGYFLVRKARETCQHERCNRHYDSDGPHDFCLECGVEIG